MNKIVALLSAEYGALKWIPDGDPLSMLVQTILSQNTSDTNSHRAFKSLRSVFPHWEDVAAAPSSEIADAIRGGGLADIKAARIKEVLAHIKSSRGKLELGFLADMPLSEARQWLTKLPGVGEKTANCVLLFSLGLPALPVDTHVHRVAGRLGLLPAKTSVEKAHRLLAEIVPPEDVYEFHVLLIEHGRRTCKAQRPRCPDCVLNGFCPSFAELANSRGDAKASRKQTKDRREVRV